MAFVILTFPRCGTHMLRTALNSHPAITCHNEIFNTDIHSADTIRRVGPTHLYEKHTGDREGFVVHNYSTEEKFDSAKLTQGLWTVLQERQPTLIALDRRDLLRRCFSVYQAIQTNRWHVWNSQKGRHPLATPSPTPDQVTWQLRMSLAQREQRQTLFPHAHLFIYEDLVQNWDDRTRTIQELIGVKVKKLRPKTQKQDQRPITDMVKNYAQLKDHFLATPYERWFTLAEAEDVKRTQYQQV